MLEVGTVWGQGLQKKCYRQLHTPCIYIYITVYENDLVAAVVPPRTRHAGMLPPPMQRTALRMHRADGAPGW